MGLWWIWNTDDSSFTGKKRHLKRTAGKGREGSPESAEKRKRNDLKSLRKKKVLGRRDRRARKI